MSEMLGNRYFIARQYDKAIPQLEAALTEDANVEKVKKKLVICYVQTVQLEKALKLFYEIIIKDPHIIIDTDFYHDDCPCPEILPSWEQKLSFSETPNDLYEVLGILYLYCDYEKSITYLKKAHQVCDHKSLIASILKKLNTSISN
jgi:tetratricopeptide (TPR) repeat protein